MTFEYLLVKHVQQTKGSGYRFFENFKDEGVVVQEVNDILPVLNHFGKEGWEFIAWDKGRMVFKRAIPLQVSENDGE